MAIAISDGGVLGIVAVLVLLGIVVGVSMGKGA